MISNLPRSSASYEPSGRQVMRLGRHLDGHAARPHNNRHPRSQDAQAGELLRWRTTTRSNTTIWS